MKRYFLFLLIATFLLCATTAVAAVLGSDHDFSISGSSNFSGGFTGDNDEVCVYCHTPHGSLGAQLPLWNKALNFPQGFTPYSSSTMDTSMPGTPSNVTLLCLSCHDGIGAINSVLNAPGPGTRSINATGNNQIGDLGSTAQFVNIGGGDPGAPGNPVDLSNDHPVSIVYNDAGGAAGGFQATPTDSRVRLINGRVECTSCHDPHADSPAIGEIQFMVMSNANSALCYACHIK